MYVCMGLGIAIHCNLFPLPFGITTGLNAIGFFSIGHLMRVWLKDISVLDRIDWWYKVLIVAVWGSLGWLVHCGMASCEVRYFPLDYVTGVTGTIICYLLSLRAQTISSYIGNVLAITGQYTVSILIIHQFISDIGWRLKLDYDNHFLFIIVTIAMAAIYVCVIYNVSKYGKNRLAK